MNSEERQLAEMLHRVTPEPPHQVTVEDVGFRLASEAGRARGGRREPRARRGPAAFSGRGRGWAPVLAAASVVVVAGASAGIAQLASRHSHASSLRDGTPSWSASVATPATSPAPSQPPASPGPPAVGARRQRDVGRGADQPPVVHSELAGQQRRLAVRLHRELPRPDRSSHRRHRADGPVQPAGPEPAGRHRERGLGGVVLPRRQRGPARLRHPDARPGRIAVSAGHRPGVQRGSGGAGRRTPRPALPGRGRHRGGGGPGQRPPDPADLPDRRRGQLGGGLARREQAVRRPRPIDLFRLFELLPAADL